MKMFRSSLICILLVILKQVDKLSGLLDIDELQNLKYGIEITKNPVLLSVENRENMLHISSKYGQMYQCAIPMKDVKISENDSSSKAQSNVTVNSILDSALEGHCLFYTLNWWTYKVCYKKEIRQYHEENGVAQGDIISLGTFHAEKEWNATSSNVKSKEVQHHHHKYVNGTVCDLVGKKREATVKFFCNEDMVNAIVSVEEPETCVYSINVHSRSLCVLSSFKPPKKESAKDITCSPALTKDQYAKYLKNEKERVEKKKEEEESLHAAQALKQSKVLSKAAVLDPLGSLVTAFTSFLAPPSPSAKEMSKEETPKDDLSNFWKDFGIDLSGTGDVVGKKSGEDANSNDIENEPKLASNGEAETEAMSGELNSMSKGDGLTVTKAKTFERTLKNGETVAELKDEIKRLFSLQETIDEVDQQAEELIRKDKEKRTIFVKHFGKSKQKAEKQIKDLRAMLSQLAVRKSKEKSTENVQHLEHMIKKIEKNLHSFQQRIERLNKKMQSSLKRSEAFEKKYRGIQDMFRNEKPSVEMPKKQEEPLVSLNEILKSLRKEHDDTEQIAKSGDELRSPEKESDADAPEVEGGTEEEKSKKNIDPLLDAVISMLKLGGKKEKEEENRNVEETKASEEVDSRPQEPLPSEKDTEKKAERNTDAKVKVRITHLGSDEVKMLEENEKQEELAGTNSANNRLKKAGKKIENMVKEKLKKAGVDLGTNVKIKIITNDGPLSSLTSKGKTDFLTDETATQFKDMLVNMLGGGTEKVKEEKRHSNLEDSYKFVWEQDEGTEERTEKKDSDPLLP